MATALAVGVDKAWALHERSAARQLFEHERIELEFPAIRAIEWLNDHTTEVLQTTQLYVFDASSLPSDC